MNSSSSKRPKISILGCGWYGMALGTALNKDGFTVKGSTTSTGKLPLLTANGIEAYQVLFKEENVHFDAAFFDCDILIISIPPRRNEGNLHWYPNQIRQIAIAAAQVKNVLFISSTSVFSDVNRTINERDVPNPSTESGQAICAAEEILKKYQFTTTILRFGGLIGPNRTLAKHFAGKAGISNGLAPINLIHLNDCIGLTKAIIETERFGLTYHGVAPHHPSRADFYTKNCVAQRLPKPDFNRELLAWKKIESINVPAIGYEYQIKNWDEWLESEW